MAASAARRSRGAGKFGPSGKWVEIPCLPSSSAKRGRDARAIRATVSRCCGIFSACRGSLRRELYDSNTQPNQCSNSKSTHRVPQITGGRWYEIFHAAPKTVSDQAGYGYVIKLINRDLPPKQLRKAIDRLGREAFATEKILHPNVIRLLDAELDRAPFFMVQPWIHGRSLDQQLSSSQQFSLSRMLWMIRQIAEAIRAAHDHGRVHLGLDPSHIMLGQKGRTTLLGWSQSHAYSERTWLPHDQLQLSRYTAPECFESDYRADYASDIYSLGALIYHSLALTPPFRGGQVDDLARAHRHDIPEDLQFRSHCVRPN